MALDDQDVEEFDAGSSDGGTLDVATDREAGAEAPSSGADKDVGSTLEIVRNVVDDREDDEPTASSADGNEAEVSAEAAPSHTERDDENFSDVPFGKHPRFQELLRQRRAFQTDAQRYQSVQAFLDTNGLDANEAANALDLIAQAKRDPVGAWQRVKPWIQELLVAAGEVLPNDLHDAVQRGEMSHAHAVEQSRLRAQVQAGQQAATFRERQYEQQALQQQTQALVSAADAWAAERQTRDPNFEAKLVPIRKEIAYLHATEGRPVTVDGVRDQLNRAYRAVNEQARPAPAAQRKPAVRPVTGGQVAGNAQPATPKNTLDIIKQVVGSRGSR